jgi:predicted hydrocarbon binding protein
MAETGVGRVLVASLHQAIADLLPARLAFYENWLNAEGLREGTIGLAPLYAVLSFLRREEGDAYAAITTKAGEYAAEWTVSSMRPMVRSFILALPVVGRRGALLLRARGLVRASYDGSRMSWSLRQGTARVCVRTSVFCGGREPATQPLCRYYAAAVARMSSLFGVPTSVSVESCRAVGAEACVLTVPFTTDGPSELAEVA